MSEQEAWLDELTPEDLPKQFHELAHVAGVRALAALSREYGGLQFYVPKYDALFKMKRDQLIRQERKGGRSYPELVKKYNLTEVWIRQICDHQGDDDKQCELFG